MKIAIVLEGGMVQHVVTSEPMEVVVIDYDTDGADQDELTAVPQDNDDPADAYVTMPMVDVNAVRVEELIALA